MRRWDALPGVMLAALAATVAAAQTAAPASQSSTGLAATVNGAVISNYDIDQRTALFHLSLDFAVSKIEDGHKGSRSKLLARHCHRLQIVRFSERPQEISVVSSCPAKNTALREHDCPGK